MNNDKKYVDYEAFVSDRISKLRIKKNVASQAMSLEIGQSRGYISQIERKEMLPSMAVFFYICEYFNISPKDFFDIDSTAPEQLNEVIADMKTLTPEQLGNIARVIKDIKR